MTLVTAYGFPHHGNRSFTFVQDDVLWSSSSRQRAFVISGWHLTVRRHSAFLADGSQLTANSSQLIADSFYLLTVFLTMTPYRPPSFWTGARMPCEKDGKQSSDMEWRIYYAGDSLSFSSPQQQILHIRSGWRLMVFFTMGVDPSLTLRMTSCHPPSFSTFSWRLTADSW